MLLLDAEHRYTLDGAPLPGVTSVLEDAGLLDFGRANQTSLEIARERGRIVHKLTELDDEGDLDDESIEPGFAGYLEGWRRFRRECELILIGVEQKVWHRTYRYAGTRDRRAIVRGVATTLDIKTGARQRATGPQLAAYQAADPEAKNDKRLGVYLQDDGRYDLEHYTGKSDLSVFLAALTLYNFKRNP